MGCGKDGARFGAAIRVCSFCVPFQPLPGGLSNCPEAANKRKWKEPERPLLRLFLLALACRPLRVRTQLSHQIRVAAISVPARKLRASLS
jgi:hypothetical protein